MIPQLSVLPSVQNWLIPDELDINHSLIESICADLKDRYMSLGCVASSYGTNKKDKQRIYKAMESIARLYDDFQYILEDKANYMKKHKQLDAS